MKNSKIKALVALHIVLLGLGIVQSCCTDEFKIRNEGSMTAYLLNDEQGFKVDTISEAFSLQAIFESYVVADNYQPSFINSAYATSCKEVHLNLLDTNSFKLTLNKAFIYNSDTIQADSDLLLLDYVKTEIWAEWGQYTTTFTNDFIAKSLFKKEHYKFKLTGKTNVGVELSTEVDLFLDL